MIRALSACVALATIASACSVGLPDNLDDYMRSHGALKASSSGDAGQAPLSGTSTGACVPTYDPDAGAASVPWQPPAQLHQNRCTDVQAQKVADCATNDPQNVTPDCRSFFTAPANQDCLACAITTESAPASGALILSAMSGGPTPNVEGCVAALSGDTSINGCGPKMLAQLVCESMVCDQCRSEQEYYACTQAADKSLCADRVAAAACADPYVSKCASFHSFAQDALTAVRMFCGAATP